MNWMKFIPVYFMISCALLILAIYSIVTFGFEYSIDFTGGSVTEYQFLNSVGKEKVEEAIKTKNEGLEIKELQQTSDKSVQLKFNPEFTQVDAQNLIATMEASISEKPELLRFETVGPSLSQEILKKTYVAIGIAALGILLWVAYQFKNIMFGVSAILAMLHDSLILLGTFAILGEFKQVEIDILFVTAMLTVLSFSVHDTIVVFDRIRETMRKNYGVSMFDLANQAVTETMVRSLNNSLTIIFMLSALFLMGGETIKWFVFALLIGTIAGTYSSPFVAVPLLVTWERLRKKLKRR